MRREALLRALLSDDIGPRPRLIIVAAHPDDEIIGAGAQLPRWPEARIIHITDGAPRNMRDAIAAGFDRREAYALHRRKEAESALHLAGIPADQLQCLCFVDQEASMNLVGMSKILAEALAAAAPDAVLTHPYEGGHPDHDATAFAVHSACQLLKRAGCFVPAILEMTSYHNRGGLLATAEFLPSDQDGAVELRMLTAHQRRLKERMFERFKSQREVLSQFVVEREAFRPAPAHNFESPPHPGTLYYERFDWGVNGCQWRNLAHAALEQLGLLQAEPPYQDSERGPQLKGRLAAAETK